MRATAYCMAAILSLLCLTGCSKDEPAQIATYKAMPLSDFCLEIPEQFEKTTSVFGYEYYVCGDASIIVTKDDTDPPYYALNDYAVTALADYKEATTSLEFIGEDVLSAPGLTVETLEFIYTIPVGDEEVTKQRYVGFMTDNAAVYAIACTSDVETFEGLRDTFVHVLQTGSIVK